ncbi:hypothetical protein [Hymenobacter sp. B81]|uniref:hypothetical protein n=1 Tax=Hymenobacter sp. B81 TaxID=3344878 RepID=UPI0037DC4993
MRHTDLSERWQVKLSEYLLDKGSKYQTLGASDFPLDSVVSITFEDDSKVEFRYAFVIEAPEWREVAVFTEHYGYHLFPLYDGMNLTVKGGRDVSASSA